MQKTELCLISPYPCKNKHKVQEVFSLLFSMKPFEVFFLSGMLELKEFSNSSILLKSFLKASTIFGPAVTIVLMGPLHELDMRAAEFHFRTFKKVFYLSLSDNEIFIRGGEMIIPGCRFNLPPGKMWEEIRTDKYFVFDEKTFGERQKEVVSIAFPGSPRYSLDGVCSPFHPDRKRTSSEMPLEDADKPTLKLSKIVVEEAPAPSTAPSTASSSAGEEIRLRFNGVKDECIIRTSPKYNFIKTENNYLCFPVGTRLKFEFPEDEVKGHSKDIFFGPRRNCVGLYDWKNEIFYIYP
jgi:hypothetical protein